MSIEAAVQATGWVRTDGFTYANIQEATYQAPQAQQDGSQLRLTVTIGDATDCIMTLHLVSKDGYTELLDRRTCKADRLVYNAIAMIELVSNAQPTTPLDLIRGFFAPCPF